VNAPEYRATDGTPAALNALQHEIHALREANAQLRLLANNVPAAIAYFERLGNTCRYANSVYAAMFGHTEQGILGLTVEQVIGQDAADFIQPQVDQVLREQRAARYERELPGDDGGPRAIEVHLLPHVDAAGASVGAFVLISDITRHRRAEAALRESEDRLAKFMLASAEGIVFHRNGLITDVNPPALALMGRRAEQMLGQPALDFVAPGQRPRVAAVMAAGAETSYDTALLHADGSEIPVQFIVRTLVYQGEQLRMTIVRDIRDRLHAQARIRHLAHHDTLTGLPNRAAFGEHAEMLLAQARRDGRTLALLYMDLDHFKRVNDSLGHAAGDLLLQTVARRITTTLRADDLVARFGGDEFVLLLSGPTDAGAAQEVASKLLAATGAPLDVDGAPISVTPSIGIALFPEHGEDVQTLLKHADTAMYRAKSRGRARCRVFEPAMADAARAELAMEGRLAQAIRHSEFVLHFQPQLALHDDALLGVEALLRWAHPERGLVGPDEFIPLAESRRLILPIGHWVLHEALTAAVRWRREGLATGPVAVNLSTLQFQAPGFAESVERALADTGASGDMLELELTERMLMDDLPAVQSALARLKALGVGIAVDDFGTGYTSLAHLKDLPLDRLKIDRSFVEDLPHDRGAAAIARAVVQMGKGLGLQVIAEGVETAAQRDWVRSAGCDGRQGFLDARPMSAEALLDWLRARKPPARG
jgi:diguanylate cyclase (GGDEF)-like protein/PAS domain S-box-containing protein